MANVRAVQLFMCCIGLFFIFIFGVKVFWCLIFIFMPVFFFAIFGA